MHSRSRSVWIKSACLSALLLVLSGTGGVLAQTGPVDYDLSGLRWRNVGPMRGGRSLTIAGSSKRPFEYYFGATGGGLWKTTDGGTVWQPITDRKIESASVGAVAVSESNPDVVYVGMGETELRGSVMQGDGIYKTIDGGKTWKHMGLEDTQAISRIRIDPNNPDVVYVAALGHVYGPNEQRGVFRSTDGGKTWKRVLFRDEKSGAIDLSMDAHDPKVLYASLWEVYRKPWYLSSGGPGSGLFKTTDGGDTWQEITRNPGLPQDLLGKINITVSGADSNRVWANVESAHGGLFRSDDAGATWTLINDSHDVRQRAFYFNRIQADPKDRDAIYIINFQIYRSTDGGKTLNEFFTPHGDHHDLWIASNNPLRMAASDDGGGSVSIDGGKTWTSQHYATAQLYHVITTKDVPYNICGTQQDSGTICVPSDGASGPEAPRGEAHAGDPAYAVAGGEDGYVAADPLNPNITYEDDQAGIIERYDRSTREARNIQVNPWFFSGMPAKDLPERWQWVFPLVFSPVDPHTLYTSSQHLWKTTNGGQTWVRISPDLTLHDPATLGDSGGPITKDQNGPEIYGTIYTIAPSHFDIKTIWVGSDDGLAHITRDGGLHWDNITPPGLPKFSRISMMDASPNKPGSAYLAANRYEMDDRHPYIFKTDDYGKTWTKIIEGIPDWDFPRTIREDPKRAGLLYLGTEHGVYVSFNNGAHWQSLSLNLPAVQASDLVVNGDDLVISTYGRSFYVLDDVGVLRQLTPGITQEQAHLFKPETAIRSVHPAVIDYFLQKPANDLRLKIVDADGTTAREFSLAAKAEDPVSSDEPQEKGPQLSNKAGLNRFKWDLRYPGAVAFAGMIFRGGTAQRGPVAVPGEYKAELTVDGDTQTQLLAVAKDPRLTDVTEADLRAQFKLARDSSGALTEANEMVIHIRAMKKQIDDRLAKADDPNVSSAGKELESGLSSVEESIYQVRNQSPKDVFNYPIRLNNQLAELTEYIEIGDIQPTDQMYSVFKELSTDLSVQKEKFDSLMENDLPKFNQLLQSEQLEPIQSK